MSYNVDVDGLAARGSKESRRRSGQGHITTMKADSVNQFFLQSEVQTLNLFLMFLKLEGVGPVDNRPSTN